MRARDLRQRGWEHTGIAAAPGAAGGAVSLWPTAGRGGRDALRPRPGPQAYVAGRFSGREWGSEVAPGRGLAPVPLRPQSSSHSTAKPPRGVWGSILLCTLVDS
jgi:hypothetical protein